MEIRRTIGGLGLGSVELSSYEQGTSSGTWAKDIGEPQYSAPGVMYNWSIAHCDGDEGVLKQYDEAGA